VKKIDIQSAVSEIEISPVEMDMILFALHVIVEKIHLREFQTRIGYYIEEVQSLIDKLHTITESNRPIENQNFPLSFDELIIIKRALGQFDDELPHKIMEKKLFQDVEELIKQMKNKTRSELEG